METGICEDSCRLPVLEPLFYDPADEDGKECPHFGVFLEFVQDLPVGSVDLFSGNPEFLHEPVNGSNMLVIVFIVDVP